MKKIFVLFLVLFYTLVSFGATLQVHSCSNNLLWKISNNKTSHDECPLCQHSSDDKEAKKKCSSGSCKDIELKFDQLTNKLFSNAKDSVLILSPAVVTLPWIQDLFLYDSTKETVLPKSYVLHYANSSPPTYLLHCIFRI